MTDSLKAARQKTTQAYVDAFYKKNGPCCAGCDWWRWLNSVVGECTRYAPNPAHNAAEGLGMHAPTIQCSANLTKRDHICGEFKDEYPWPE